MRPVRVTHAQWAARVAQRPAGYAELLAPAIVHRDDEGIVLDADHPAWAEALRRYRPAPPPAPAPPPPSDQEVDRRLGVCLACAQLLEVEETPALGVASVRCRAKRCPRQRVVVRGAERCPRGLW